jgi:hypothetical protein
MKRNALPALHPSILDHKSAVSKYVGSKRKLYALPVYHRRISDRV